MQANCTSKQDLQKNGYLVRNVIDSFRSLGVNARPGQRQKQNCSCYEAASLWSNILQLPTDRHTHTQTSQSTMTQSRQSMHVQV